MVRGAMEQDDKVSAAALSLGSATGSSARTARAMASSDHAGASAEALPSGEPPSAARSARNVRTEPEVEDDESSEDTKSGTPSSPPKKSSNNVRRIRIERMMSKAELARRANLSVLTIDRVERGYGCRMDTKRKILEALGLSLADRVRVFGEEE
jgi:DNA-binding XRE family transcriptional regulator